jgi:predicted transcriptional regulator
MFVPCEFAVRLIIPTVRAVIAKELHHTYKLRQHEIASLLNVTQSAISQYLRNKRGHAIPVDHYHLLAPLITDIAEGLVTNSLIQKEIAHKYCRICRMIRGGEWFCDLHKTLDPTITNDVCSVCLSTTCF